MLYWRWFNRPRHPMLRGLLALVGAVLLVGVLALGFFALLAFAFIGTIVALTRAITRAHGGAAQAARATADPRVLEGEFVVLHRDAAPLNR